MSDYNLPKKVLKKTRDTFLASVNDQLQSLNRRMEDLARNQLKIDAMIREVHNRVLHSGMVRISETEVMTKIFSGAKFYLDPHDLSIVPHLILDGEWEHNITQAWLQTVRKGDVVIDIGANFGYYGVLAAQQANRDAKVIFFEANPNLIPYITKTVAVNSLDDCSVIENLAITNKKGKVVLNILKDYIASSSIHSEKEINKYMHGKFEAKIDTSVTVEGVPLDVYCQQHDIQEVNLIKMDIEGFEDKAYAGMRKIVSASPNITMFIEFTRESYENPEAFYNQMLKDFGSVYVISPAGEIIKPKDDSYAGVIANSNEWVMPIFSKSPKLHLH